MRYMYGLLFLALVLFAPGAQRTLADVGGVHPTLPARDGAITPEDLAAVRMSSALVGFCNQAIVKYRKAMAVLQAPVVVPVPPPIPPGCTQCGEETSKDNRSAIDDWLKKSLDPEATAMRDLLAVLRVYTLIGYVPDPNVETDTTALTPLAKLCLQQIPPASLVPSIQKLIARQNTKADKMVHQYHKDSDRMPAGVQLALTVARETALWNGGEAENGALATAAEWVQTAFEKYDQHLFKDHEYFWCPQFDALLGQLKLDGSTEEYSYTFGGGGSGIIYKGGGIPTILSNEELQKHRQRILDFMHFKIKMNVQLISNDHDSHTNVKWTGESELSFDIDKKKGCFTPKLQDDGIRVTVDDWLMRGRSGSRDVNTELVGPRVFDAPATVRLGLCDPNPKMVIRFANFGPPSTMRANGQETSGDIFQLPMITAIVEDKKKDGQLSAERSTMNKDLQDLKNEVSKHSNDPSWFMSPEGQLVLKKIQGASSGASIGTPSFAQDMMVDKNMNLPWQQGQTTVVDRDMNYTKGDTHVLLHITITNDPQNGSESGTS